MTTTARAATGHGSITSPSPADLPRLDLARPAATPLEPVPAPPKRAFVEQIMGMPISIHVRGPRVHQDRAVAEAVAAAFAELRRADEVFSTWRPDSQISRWRRGELDLAGCEPEVGEVVRLCEQARERTGGWFDAHLPGGFDPTGLVKGWAVERCCRQLGRALDRHAPQTYDVLVNAGGDVAARTARTDRPAWTIGIEDPRDRCAVLARVPLRTGGVATSGSAARGGHVVSPRTGQPVTDLGSVTVIGPSLMWADVYATAGYARGDGCLQWLATSAATAGHSWLVVDADGVAHPGRGTLGP